ncbi:MAG: 4Fe-4S binding protein [Chloroflexota bacterium]
MKTAIPEVDSEKCTGCGDCVEQCPTDAVEVIDGKAVIVRPGDCTYCTDCEAYCPAHAIRCPYEIVLLPAGTRKRTPVRRSHGKRADGTHTKTRTFRR